MVHDLAVLHMPQLFPRLQVWRQRLLLPGSVRRAARVLTPSQFCKDEIVRTFAVPPARVVVTPEGVSDHFQRVENPARDRALARYGIAPPYLLFVGNIQPPGIIGPGHQIATDSKGNLYIAQTTAGVQKLTFKGMSAKAAQ